MEKRNVEELEQTIVKAWQTAVQAVSRLETELLLADYDYKEHYADKLETRYLHCSPIDKLETRYLHCAQNTVQTCKSSLMQAYFDNIIDHLAHIKAINKEHENVSNNTQL